MPLQGLLPATRRRHAHPRQEAAQDPPTRHVASGNPILDANPWFISSLTSTEGIVPNTDTQEVVGATIDLVIATHKAHTNRDDTHLPFWPIPHSVPFTTAYRRRLQEHLEDAGTRADTIPTPFGSCNHSQDNTKRKAYSSPDSRTIKYHVQRWRGRPTSPQPTIQRRQAGGAQTFSYLPLLSAFIYRRQPVTCNETS